MKKSVLIALLTACLLLSCSGCDASKSMEAYRQLPETYQLETDYPSTFFAGSLGPFVAPAPGGYYTFIGRFLYFIDADTMQASVLCNRPECRHEKETDPEKIPLCNAYVQHDRTPMLQYYEGNIYTNMEYYESDDAVVTSCALVRISADGSSRKILCPLDKGQYSFYAIHRGYLYSLRQDESKSYFSRIQMDRLGQKPEILLQWNADGATCFPIFDGNYFYLNRYKESEEEKTVVPMIQCCDLKTGDWSTVFMGSKEFSDAFEARYIYKDSLLCVSIKNIVFTEDEFRQGLRYYLLDPDTKELCSLVDYQSAGYNDADNNACYDADYLRSDGVNLCQMHLEETKSPKERSIIFRNQDMEATGSVPYGEIYGYTDFAPGDSDYSFLGGIGYSWEHISLYLIDKTGEEPVVTPVIERDGNEVYPPIGPSVLS